jgi:hypothetical protein
MSDTPPSDLPSLLLPPDSDSDSDEETWGLTLNGSRLRPAPLGGDHPLAKLKIVSLNFDGVFCEKPLTKGGANKRLTLFRWLLDEVKADIVLATETHITGDLRLQARVAREWAKGGGGKVICTPSLSSSSRGTAIFIRSGCDITIDTDSIYVPVGSGSREAPLKNRVTLAQMDWHGHRFSVGSVYAPVIESERPRFFKALKQVLSDYTVRGPDGLPIQPTTLLPCILGGIGTPLQTPS